MPLQEQSMGIHLTLMRAADYVVNKEDRFDHGYLAPPPRPAWWEIDERVIEASQNVDWRNRSGVSRRQRG
jgi:L-alanine-DL-glutamate epimerase-like enolase superfamily enzyme